MAEKILNSYETIFIIDASLDEESVKGLQEKFTSLIEKNGTVESVDEWGKRRLAYEINDKTEGSLGYLDNALSRHLTASLYLSKRISNIPISLNFLT